MFQRFRTQESGFTLVELLVAIMVSGLILTAVGTAFIVTARGSQNVHDRFIESHDAELLATYFPTDVQSANPTLIELPGDTDVSDCTGVTGTRAVRFLWTETDETTKTVFSSSYQVVSSASGSTLYRYFCSNSGPKDNTEQAIL